MSSWDASATCSTLNSDEPLLGSASHYPLWLAVDCPKPWNSKIQKSTGFPEAARGAVEALLTSGMEFGLIGRVPAAAAGSLSVYRFDGVFREARISLDDEAALMTLARAEWEGLTWSAPGRALYVCTHGSRDNCCARLGVPLLQALRDLRSDLQLWEASHLGGHRFAPTLLAFPSGRLYGRVSPSHAGPFLAALADESPTLVPWLRGHSAYSSPLQIIEAALLGRCGSFPLALHELTNSMEEVKFWARFPDGERPGVADFSTAVHRGPQSCGDIPRGVAKDVVHLQLKRLEL